MSRMHHRFAALLVAAAALITDLTTKMAALAYAHRLSDGIEVLPVFNLVFIYNRGVSFGLFGFVPWWALTAGGGAIVVILMIWLWRARDVATATGIGLIIGGALGNLVDRIWHRAVIDFLDFHLFGYHWPAFNMADVAIVLGVAVLLLASAANR